MSTPHPAHSFKPGATWEIRGPLSYANGLPFDLSSGCAIAWAIQSQDNIGTNVLELTLAGGGITVLDAAGGVCLITVTPSQSAAIPVGNYFDQLRATDPTGYVSDQWAGPINVYKSFFD